MGTVPSAVDGRAVAKSMGWQEANDIIMSWPSFRAMLQDGPSVYGYARQTPLVLQDSTGTQTQIGVLACPFGAFLNPACDAGLISSGVTIAVGVVGICEMAKGGKQNIDNEYSREAKDHPGPCQYLRDLLKKTPDGKERRKISAAQKFLGCKSTGGTY